MSNSHKQPWSNGPNAPKIPYSVYIEEKADFAGMLLASILYGVLTVLFFRCMVALFNPVNRNREGIKWGLVAYTVAMFSFATVLAGMALNIESISYIDNREFPGGDGLSPGPLGYRSSIWSGALTVTPSLMFLLNNWLADGFLLYRCYVIYSSNFWVTALPGLMFLASVVSGFMIVISQACRWGSAAGGIAFDFSIPYVSVSISLNILLTLMIVARLVLHGGDLRATIGSPVGINGLYRTVATMLIESSALFAVNSLLLIGLWGARSGAADVFLPIVAEIQVIAPLLIIQRVANRRSLTCNTVATGRISSFRFRGRGESGVIDTLPDGCPTSSADNRERKSGDVVVRIETTIDLTRDSKV